ncbi:alpha/beta hydrolase [Serratia surfactantfaciens]|uniref:alpha/beta hydrolase n=1 Tax=Serratia surfactantfaciens TaxID=2741499 RepID=UPI0018E417C8|nr:alpha/beta hydrolase-fold protein [Serratia surfactantfaciens]MBI6154952.1 alpha/beta hydrolase [Serratia surfactantfaciens]
MCEDLISRTKCFVFNGQRYRVFISHRRGIGGNLNPLYLLDANSQFSVVTECNNRKRDGDILYVGIGYQDGVDVLKARTRDYTVPSGEKEFAEGGGAAAFYQFIAACVKPWVEAHYPVNVDRQTLAGHSHGGHFVLYTLFNHPDAFQNYLAASPSIWWGNGALIPDGKLAIDEHVNQVTLMVGEYEEKLHPQSNETEKMQILRMNATPKLRARNLAEKLIGNEQRCSFVFCTGRRHPGVIKDYAQVANLIAGHRPQYDGL